MKKYYFTTTHLQKKKVLELVIFTFFLFLLGVTFFACGLLANSGKNINPDLSPPVFQELSVQSAELILLIFNEPSSLLESNISINPELTLKSISSSGNSIFLYVSHQVPGKEYTLTATCEDNQENSLQFIATFYGFNPQIPKLVINEFTTRGSSTHPDIIELKVLKSGNMGGVVCYQGTSHFWDNRIIFPVFPVQSGDFILIHFKPGGILCEIDETDNKDISCGSDASPHAYDFWVKDGAGISGNNGVLSLYHCPGGRLIDGVLYSNRTSESDENYMGFGTKKVMERALELESSGGWIPEQEQIKPGDGINPDGSTATRSLCRDRNGTDTNTRYDWHIVPTRKSSFGEENCEDIYDGLKK